MAGWIVARGWAAAFLWSGGIIYAINTYLIASWFDWQFGGSYGHRGFTDGFALVAVFMASLFVWTAERRGPVADSAIGWTVTVCATLAVLLSVAQMVQYWLGIRADCQHDVGPVPRAVPALQVARVVQAFRLAVDSRPDDMG